MYGLVVWSLTLCITLLSPPCDVTLHMTLELSLLDSILDVFVVFLTTCTENRGVTCTENRGVTCTENRGVTCTDKAWEQCREHVS